jgi:hypothetical protein|tara:strand:+ start:638 stop:919 length:282 start_codon:yes stop_codon:yes gene_type:complete
MIKMILVLNEQEKITLKRCLSLFIEQAKEKLIVADQVEIQTAQQIWDSVLEVETEDMNVIITKLNKSLKGHHDDTGTNSPHEPKTSYERDEPA